MKRILSVFIISIAIVLALSPAVYAEKVEAAEAAFPTEKGDTAPTVPEGDAAVMDESEALAPSGAVGGEAEAEKPPVTEIITAEKERGIYEIVLSHTSEILSILTFLISVFLTFFYKRDLLPAIDSSVKTIGSRAEESIVTAERAVLSIDGKIGGMSDTIEAFSKYLSEIEGRMIRLEEGRGEGEEIRVMIASQVEELYEIVMSPSGEISRESLEEKITAIRSHFESDTKE